MELIQCNNGILAKFSCFLLILLCKFNQNIENDKEDNDKQDEATPNDATASNALEANHKFPHMHDWITEDEKNASPAEFSCFIPYNLVSQHSIPGTSIFFSLFQF